jgi:hypothetical protein
MIKIFMLSIIINKYFISVLINPTVHRLYCSIFSMNIDMINLNIKCPKFALPTNIFNKYLYSREEKCVVEQWNFNCPFTV